MSSQRGNYVEIHVRNSLYLLQSALKTTEIFTKDKGIMFPADSNVTRKGEDSGVIESSDLQSQWCHVLESTMSLLVDCIESSSITFKASSSNNALEKEIRFSRQIRKIIFGTHRLLKIFNARLQCSSYDSTYDDKLLEFTEKNPRAPINSQKRCGSMSCRCTGAGVLENLRVHVLSLVQSVSPALNEFHQHLQQHHLFQQEQQQQQQQQQHQQRQAQASSTPKISALMRQIEQSTGLFTAVATKEQILQLTKGLQELSKRPVG